MRLTLAALLIASAAMLAMPVALRYLIDNGFIAQDIGTVNRYFGWFLAAALVFQFALQRTWRPIQVFVVIAVTLVVIGVAGLALPALPGAPLVFIGLVVAAWAEDFQYLGTGGIVALAVLALLTYPIDILAGAMGAKPVPKIMPASISSTPATMPSSKHAWHSSK